MPDLIPLIGWPGGSPENTGIIAGLIVGPTVGLVVDFVTNFFLRFSFCSFFEFFLSLPCATWQCNLSRMIFNVIRPPY